MNEKNNSYIFIDAEYCFTCAVREGKIPNYVNLNGLFEKEFSPCIKIVYHSGPKAKKKKVSDFILKNGFDYSIIYDYPHTFKTQIVGAAMAIDTMKAINRLSEGEDPYFVYLSGDDYLIPILDEVRDQKLKVCVFHYQQIISRALHQYCKECNVRLKTLFDRYSTFPDKNHGE